jgi:hypothetical protein
MPLPFAFAVPRGKQCAVGSEQWAVNEEVYRVRESVDLTAAGRFAPRSLVGRGDGKAEPFRTEGGTAAAGRFR